MCTERKNTNYAGALITSELSLSSNLFQKKKLRTNTWALWYDRVRDFVKSTLPTPAQRCVARKRRRRIWQLRIQFACLNGSRIRSPTPFVDIWLVHVMMITFRKKLHARFWILSVLAWKLKSSLKMYLVLPCGQPGDVNICHSKAGNNIYISYLL